MKWQPFQHNNNKYDLSHLHPFALELIQPAQGDKLEKKYTFWVRFSLHCFSKSIEDGDDPSLEYRDNRETRTFCHKRYELSFYLPEIIREINEKRCSHTGYGNFFLVEFLTEEGATIEYEIYFNVRRTKSSSAQLELFIQSAYARSNESKKYRHETRKIGFFVIANNRLLGKPIKTPR